MVHCYVMCYTLPSSCCSKSPTKLLIIAVHTHTVPPTGNTYTHTEAIMFHCTDPGRLCTHAVPVGAFSGLPPARLLVILLLQVCRAW